MAGKGVQWRGMDGEEDMTDEDWQARGLGQALSMLNGLTAEQANPDDEGIPTGGCYNGDYPQSWHDALNAQLDSDEYYEAEVTAKVRELKHVQDDS